MEATLPFALGTFGGTPISAARISECGRYRYELTRIWDADRSPLWFAMLNPSTADDKSDDPTIRRVIGFARREDAGGVVVVNLFALRATDPRVLQRAEDPFGPDNDAALRAAAQASRDAGNPIVCAWGTQGSIGGGAARFIRLCAEERVALSCLGVTKEGHPRHPLYLRSDAPLRAFEPNSGGAACEMVEE